MRVRSFGGEAAMVQGFSKRIIVNFIFKTFQKDIVVQQSLRDKVKRNSQGYCTTIISNFISTHFKRAGRGYSNQSLPH